METPKSIIELLFEKVEEYGITTYELTKLKLLKTIALMVPSLLSRLIVVFIISSFIFILSIGIALFLGDLLGELYYGFFIIAAFYLVVGIVLHFYLHKWIKKPVANSIIKQILQ
ncbi:MAG: hypothetical protein WC389_05680 [Lutibacter sp.]|jgi:hypothetical protein